MMKTTNINEISQYYNIPAPEGYPQNVDDMTVRQKFVSTLGAAIKQKFPSAPEKEIDFWADIVISGIGGWSNPDFYKKLNAARMKPDERWKINYFGKFTSFIAVPMYGMELFMEKYYDYAGMTQDEMHNNHRKCVLAEMEYYWFLPSESCYSDWLKNNPKLTEKQKHKLHHKYYARALSNYIGHANLDSFIDYCFQDTDFNDCNKACISEMFTAITDNFPVNETQRDRMFSFILEVNLNPLSKLEWYFQEERKKRFR